MSGANITSQSTPNVDSTPRCEVMVRHEIDMRGLTKTQQRMLEVLLDGEPHWAEELRLKLYDDLGPNKNMANHLTAIRKTLILQGRLLVTHRMGRGETQYSIVFASNRAKPTRPDDPPANSD